MAEPIHPRERASAMDGERRAWLIRHGARVPPAGLGCTCASGCSGASAVARCARSRCLAYLEFGAWHAAFQTRRVARQFKSKEHRLRASLVDRKKEVSHKNGV